MRELEERGQPELDPERGQTAQVSAGQEAPEEQLKAAPADTVETGSEQENWRPTVWFNPWMYQSGEQVWAGLAHEVISQITGRMSRAEGSASG